jgi:tetraacyldisaccharide 4'-kinase
MSIAQNVTFWVKIKRWYIAFIEKEKRSLLEIILYFILYLLSLIYGFIVRVRNSLYDSKVLPSLSSAKRIVSIGSLVWGGSGKTTLSIYLYHKLANHLRVCVLRRGYGKDENRLLQEEIKDVFFCPDRVDLVKRLSRYFDCFILDDGFQYRRLRRNIDIVIMNAHQLKKNVALIPAYSFREPLGSLKRAD